MYIVVHRRLLFVWLIFFLSNACTNNVPFHLKISATISPNRFNLFLPPNLACLALKREVWKENGKWKKNYSSHGNQNIFVIMRST